MFFSCYDVLGYVLLLIEIFVYYRFVVEGGRAIVGLIVVDRGDNIADLGFVVGAGVEVDHINGDGDNGTGGNGDGNAAEGVLIWIGGSLAIVADKEGCFAYFVHNGIDYIYVVGIMECAQLLQQVVIRGLGCFFHVGFYI